MRTQTFIDYIQAAKRYEDELVGIEMENEGDEGTDKDPYFPDDVRISQHMYSVYQICHWIDEEVLELSPEFQRNKVWDVTRMSLLIESLMLKIPLPSFYFQEDNDGNKQVIDGLQRLSSIYSYINGEFRLRGLQYLTDFNGVLYHDLPKKYRTRIEETQLAVNTLDSRCHDLVKFDVFRRVNTGGVPLNSQEIRNIMSSPRTRKFLKSMSQCEEFIKATRGRISDLRMDAQELCLRFVAFYRRYDPETGELKDLEALTTMLDKTILELNKESIGELCTLAETFGYSMERCYALLGDAAFSKQGMNHIINKPLFVSWSVVLAHSETELWSLEEMRKKAVLLQQKYFGEGVYYNAITSSTASKPNTRLQFEGVNKILGELFS